MTAVITAAGNTQDQTIAAPVDSGMRAATTPSFTVDWLMFLTAMVRARLNPMRI